MYNGSWPAGWCLLASCTDITGLRVGQGLSVRSESGSGAVCDGAIQRGGNSVWRAQLLGRSRDFVVRSFSADALHSFVQLCFHVFLQQPCGPCPTVMWRVGKIMEEAIKKKQWKWAGEQP